MSRLLSSILALAVLATGCAASTTTITAAPTAAGESSEPTAQDDQAPAVVDESSTTSAPTPLPVDESADVGDTTEQPAPTTGAETATDPTLGVQVQVLDAGAEPRSELRLVIAPTCGEVLTMIQTIELSQTIDEIKLPSTGAVATQLEVSISVTPSGDNFIVESEITGAGSGPGTPAAAASQTDAALAQAIGVTTRHTITNRGVLVPGTDEIEGTEAFGPLADMAEGLNQLQAPLPSEPVGVGARWEVTNVLEVQGLVVETRSVNEIVSIDGTIVVIETQSTQAVADGAVMDLQGVSAEVTEWDIDSSGSSTIDLATISPITATSVTEGTQGFRFAQGASEGLLLQELRNETEISSAPDDGCTGRSVKS